MSEIPQGGRDALEAALMGSFDPEGMTIGAMSAEMSQLIIRMQHLGITIPFTSDAGVSTVMKDNSFDNAYDVEDLLPHLSEEEIASLIG